MRWARKKALRDMEQGKARRSAMDVDAVGARMVNEEPEQSGGDLGASGWKGGSGKGEVLAALSWLVQD